MNDNVIVGGFVIGIEQLRVGGGGGRGGWRGRGGGGEGGGRGTIGS